MISDSNLLNLENLTAEEKRPEARKDHKLEKYKGKEKE